MSGFEYSALDATGRETRGVIEADTDRHARSLLRERGLAPLTVEGITRSTVAHTGRGERFSRPRLSRKGLALVTRQFATLVRAGLTIEESLNVLIEQTESAGARTLFAAVRARVLEGQSLSHSLAAFPDAFPQIYRAMIEAGGASGAGVAAAPADRGAAHPHRQRRALCRHPGNPYLERSALAHLAAVRSGSRHQPADARRCGRSGAARARRRGARAGPGRGEALSAARRTPDRERRGDRAPGHHARARGGGSVAGTGELDPRSDCAPRAIADPRDGRDRALRGGRDTLADFRDEPIGALRKPWGLPMPHCIIPIKTTFSPRCLRLNSSAWPPIWSWSRCRSGKSSTNPAASCNTSISPPLPFCPYTTSWRMAHRPKSRGWAMRACSGFRFSWEAIPHPAGPSCRPRATGTG